MKINRLSAVALALLFVAPTLASAAPPLAPAAQSEAPPAATFTDSTGALLAGTKRVAITDVIISFQASTGARAGGTFFVPMLSSRTEVQTVLAMKDMNEALQDAIAGAAYKALAAQLAAAGYDVVPQDQVTASANYKAILAQSGFTNHAKFANAMGDVVLVGAPGLAPYSAYQGEVGNFQYPTTTYLSWISGFGGKSVTPGGPSIMSQGNAWKVPGLEVALAKELNAHVVKAFYVVSLGKAEAKRSTSFSTSEHSGFFTSGGDLYMGNYRTLDRTVTGKGKAFGQVGLMADQSHIAFRTPNGNAKWQKVTAMKVVPPKDGDVVVRISEPVIGSTDNFDVVESDFQKAGGFFSGQKRADLNLAFDASISNADAYGKEVTGMIDTANKAMIALVPAQ